MKLAGAKNDGAWFRSNQQMHGLTDTQKTRLATLIQDLPGMAAYIAALSAFETKTGVTIQSGTSDFSSATLATTYVTNGIPRQVWFGVMTFDTYTKQADGSYTKDTEPSLRVFAKQLRHTVRRYLFAQRQLNDVTDLGDIDTGNPGGNPDTVMPKPK
jgi:hypothetical protein